MNRDKIVEALKQVALEWMLGSGGYDKLVRMEYAAIAPLIEPKVISVEKLEDKFVAYFRELPMWGSYKSMSSALVDIAAPYIRREEEAAAGDEDEVLQKVITHFPTTLSDFWRKKKAREIIALVSASKDGEIERLKAELSVFKEGMRAIKSALDFIQSN